MYILSWNDDNNEYSVKGDYKSVWQTYYVIKESMKKTYPIHNHWIRCRDKNGFYIDLTKGVKCEYFPEGYNGRILLRPASSI